LSAAAGAGEYMVTYHDGTDVIMAPASGVIQLGDAQRLAGRTTFIGSPVEGDIVRLASHATLDDGLYVYNGSAWVPFITW